MKTVWKHFKSLSHRISSDEAGQSLVEFAIMSIILIIILMGILDLGRAYYAYVALQDVVAEGAAFGATSPTCVDAGDGPDCSNPNNIIWRAKSESPSGMVISNSIQVSVMHDPTGMGTGKTITVSATYSHPLMTFVIGSIVGSDTLLLRASSSSSIK